MENSYHLNFIGRRFIENRERKAMNNGTPQRSVNSWILVRIGSDARQRFIDAVHELSVEIVSLASVPLTGFGDFVVGFGSEPNDHLSYRDFMNSALISSQVRPWRGLAVTDAMRRSSSCRCPSVNSNAWFSMAIVSQISSTRRIRSAMLSFRAAFVNSLCIGPIIAFKNQA